MTMYVLPEQTLTLAGYRYFLLRCTVFPLFKVRTMLTDVRLPGISGLAPQSYINEMVKFQLF